MELRRVTHALVRVVPSALVAFTGDGELILCIRGEPPRRLGRLDRCPWCPESEFHVCKDVRLQGTWTYFERTLQERETPTVGELITA